MDSVLCSHWEGSVIPALMGTIITLNPQDQTPWLTLAKAWAGHGHLPG